MFGISGKRWIHAIRASISSILASFAGGMVGFLYSLITKKGKTDVMMACNGILAGCISIMAGCVAMTNFEAIVTGAVGAVLSILGTRAVIWMKIDDPVGEASH